MFETLALAATTIFASATGAVAPYTEAAPICPDTLCYHEAMEADAYYALNNSTYLANTTEETRLDFIGYIDAPYFDEALDFSAVQITDSEGVTYVFSTSQPANTIN